MLRLHFHALILGVALTVVACGKDTPLPIALKTVNAAPEPEDNPKNPSKDALPKTLLEEVVKQGVPRELAELAFDKYDRFVDHIENKDYISIIDFTKHSGKKRFYMINTENGKVDFLLVAHGVGSDRNNTGTPNRFSNIPDSKTSSLGAYIVNETYPSSKHGKAARLDGLEKTNSLVRDRAIVLHSASYVSTSLTKMGMSWGCPAISLEWIKKALSRLVGGSFMYAYAHPKDNFVDDALLKDIMTNPAYQWVNEGEDAPSEGEF